MKSESIDDSTQRGKDQKSDKKDKSHIKDSNETNTKNSNRKDTKDIKGDTRNIVLEDRKDDVRKTPADAQKSRTEECKKVDKTKTESMSVKPKTQTSSKTESVTVKPNSQMSSKNESVTLKAMSQTSSKNESVTVKPKSQTSIKNESVTVKPNSQTSNKTESVTVKPNSQTSNKTESVTVKPNPQTSSNTKTVTVKQSSQTSSKIELVTVKPNSETSKRPESVSVKPNQQTSSKNESVTVKPNSQASIKMESLTVKPNSQTSIKTEAVTVKPNSQTSSKTESLTVKSNSQTSSKTNKTTDENSSITGMNSQSRNNNNQDNENSRMQKTTATEAKSMYKQESVGKASASLNLIKSEVDTRTEEGKNITGPGLQKEKKEEPHKGTNQESHIVKEMEKKLESEKEKKEVLKGVSSAEKSLETLESLSKEKEMLEKKLAELAKSSPSRQALVKHIPLIAKKMEDVELNPQKQTTSPVCTAEPDCIEISEDELEEGEIVDESDEEESKNLDEKAKTSEKKVSDERVVINIDSGEDSERDLEDPRYKLSVTVTGDPNTAHRQIQFGDQRKVVPAERKVVPSERKVESVVSVVGRASDKPRDRSDLRDEMYSSFVDDKLESRYEKKYERSDYRSYREENYSSRRRERSRSKDRRRSDSSNRGRSRSRERRRSDSRDRGRSRERRRSRSQERRSASNSGKRRSFSNERGKAGSEGLETFGVKRDKISRSRSGELIDSSEMFDDDAIDFDDKPPFPGSQAAVDEWRKLLTKEEKRIETIKGEVKTKKTATSFEEELKAYSTGQKLSMTVRDWVKDEFKNLDIDVVEEHIIVNFDLDIFTLSKNQRKTFRNKVRTQIEALKLKLEKATKEKEAKRLAGEALANTGDQRKVVMNPGPSSSCADTISQQINLAIVPFQQLNIPKFRIKEELTLVRAHLKLIWGKTQSFIDSETLPENPDTQALFGLRQDLQSIEQDMMARFNSYDNTMGVHHRRLPSALLTKQEMSSHMSEEQLVLLLCGAIPMKPYHKLIKLREELEDQKAKLKNFKACQNNPGINKFNNLIIKTHEARKAIMLTFTGPLSKKRQNKLRMKLKTYRNCVDYFTKELGTMVNTKLAFLKATWRDLERHYAVITHLLVSLPFLFDWTLVYRLLMSTAWLSLHLLS